MRLVRQLSRPGHALGGNAPTSTIRNPEWWIDDEPTPVRRKLHRRLLAEARAKAMVEKARRAIILAGPPGAGKSTVLENELSSGVDKFLIVDADDFKRALLREAQTDGSYDSWLVPPAIRDLEREGERFFPLELASLVHEESSYLAKELRADAIAEGENFVLDTVLSNEQNAFELGNTLRSLATACTARPWNRRTMHAQPSKSTCPELPLTDRFP